MIFLNSRSVFSSSMLSFRGVSKIDSECGSSGFPPPLIAMSQVDVLAATVPPVVRGIAEDLKLRRRYTMILKHSWNIHQTFDLFNLE